MTSWKGGHVAIVGLILIHDQTVDEPISVLESGWDGPYIVGTGGGERGAVATETPRVSGPGSAEVRVDDLVDSLLSGRGTWGERGNGREREGERENNN